MESNTFLVRFLNDKNLVPKFESEFDGHGFGHACPPSYDSHPNFLVEIRFPNDSGSKCFISSAQKSTEERELRTIFAEEIIS